VGILARTNNNVLLKLLDMVKSIAWRNLINF